MIATLKEGHQVIKTTKKYEIYRLGDKIYKFIFKSRKICRMTKMEKRRKI